MDRIIRREPADWRHSVAFTGHRPQKLPFGFDETDPRCVDFKRRLCNSIEMMILEGYTHFISGGALGMDMYAAEAVLTLREQYPEITLEIAIPHDGQTAKWPQSLRDRAERIREEADVITWIAHEYTKRCLFDRNYYMVSHCSVLLACFDGQHGGTAQTIETAHRLGGLCGRFDGKSRNTTWHPPAPVAPFKAASHNSAAHLGAFLLENRIEEK